MASSFPKDYQRYFKVLAISIPTNSEKEKCPRNLGRNIIWKCMDLTQGNIFLLFCEMLTEDFF